MAKTWQPTKCPYPAVKWNTTDAYNKMDESQKPIASKKLDAKEPIQCNSIYMKIYRQN